MQLSAASSREDQLWRQRRLLLASAGAVAFAVVVLVISVPTHWHWTLLIWGVLVGVVGASILELVYLIALRRGSPSAEQRIRFNRRRLINGSGWLFYSAVAGVLAAAFDQAWIDLVLTAWAALSLGAGAVVLFVVARRRSAEQ